MTESYVDDCFSQSHRESSHRDNSREVVDTRQVWGQPEKSREKREKNKQAAKNSRERKKVYVQVLQEKKEEKLRLLKSREKQLEEAQDYYERLLTQKQTMSSFAASRHQLIKRLESLLEAEKQKTGAEIQQPAGSQAIDEQINLIIDSLRSRIGATGRQRINTINQYFQQIVNLFLPALHRYMMWSASEQKHLFAANQDVEAEHEEWFKQLKDSLNLTEEQKREIRDKREQLKEQKKVLQGLIDDLRDVKDLIEKKSVSLDQLIDRVRKILTPIQCAHFILFIEKNKYRKQLNMCEAGSEAEPEMRKLIKREK